MMPKFHLLWSLPVTLVYFYITRNIILSSIFLFAAVIIDIDHILDYIFTYKKFNLKHSMKGRWFKNKLYVILHSYELIIILFVIYNFYRNNIIFAFTLGMCYHILLDAVSNGLNSIWFYSLIYRSINKFDIKVFCNG